MEHFLGPRSFLRTEEPQSIIDDLKKRFKEAEQKVEHGVRGRRSIKTEVDNFDKHVSICRIVIVFIIFFRSLLQKWQPLFLFNLQNSIA